MDLNPAQREAVEVLKGPVLVLAGAGTGKTRVITARVARLIERGVRPERILAVTFTNKAAREMEQRALVLLEKRVRKRPEISTFHSLCVRILRRNADKLGFPRKFAIHDTGDQESVARAVLRDLRIPSDAVKPAQLLYAIGRWKNRSILPERASAEAMDDSEVLAARAYARYQEVMRARGALDFDDLLLLTEMLFRDHPGARAAEARRFDHILIDEYQDTNGPQYRIVRHLAAGHRNLCVVGDDDQAIYGFRGADVAHILRFKKDWPDARVIRLEDNYRSCAGILDLANRLIANNRSRHKKTLRAALDPGTKPRVIVFKDDAHEAAGVVHDIRQDRESDDIAARDVAILFRTNEQPRAFETELRRARIPYVLVGGMSFYDRREVRDVLAYMKVLAHPADEVSLLRIINTPARGIGKGSVAILIEEAVKRGRPLWEVLENVASLARVPGNVARAVRSFVDLLKSNRARLASGTLAESIRGLLKVILYREELTREYPDALDREARLSAVDELIGSLQSYEERSKRPSLQEFLQEIAISNEGAEKSDEDQRKGVTLMTLHAAKGLEFKVVYLTGMEESILPHQRSLESGKAGIEEERRLAYVGVTRARERLTFTLCESRLKWGRPRPSVPSRFLLELFAGDSGAIIEKLKALSERAMHAHSPQKR